MLLAVHASAPLPDMAKPSYLPLPNPNTSNLITTVTNTTASGTTILPPPKEFEQRINSQSMHNLRVPSTSSKCSSKRSSMLSVCSRCRTTHEVAKSTSQDQQFKYVCDNRYVGMVFQKLYEHDALLRSNLLESSHCIILRFACNLCRKKTHTQYISRKIEFKGFDCQSIIMTE